MQSDTGPLILNYLIDNFEIKKSSSQIGSLENATLLIRFNILQILLNFITPDKPQNKCKNCQNRENAKTSEFLLFQPLGMLRIMLAVRIWQGFK